MVGSIDTEHGLSVMLAKQLGIVVVAVEYRLAPDCCTALQWLRNHASVLDVNTRRN